MRDDPAVTDLVRRASNGDRLAWDAVVERYAPLIWCICRRYRLRDADTEDVGQAVWLHLVQHIDGLRNPAALPGWLATTTRRECHRVLRVTRDVPVGEQDLQNMQDEQTASAERDILVAERNAALRKAFGNLPQGCQRLLAMLLSDPPMPYAEISARLGIPVGSIGPNRRRYLERLRRDPAIASMISFQTVGDLARGQRGWMWPGGGGRWQPLRLLVGLPPPPRGLAGVQTPSQDRYRGCGGCDLGPPARHVGKEPTCGD